MTARDRIVIVMCKRRLDFASFLLREQFAQEISGTPQSKSRMDSAKDSGNIYCQLGAHLGLWEAMIEDAQEVVRIGWVCLRGIPF